MVAWQVREKGIKKAFPVREKLLVLFCLFDYAFLPEASRFLSILCDGRVHFGFSPKAWY